MKIRKVDHVLEDDWEDDLTNEQKADIERGLKDVDEGKVTVHEVVRSKYGLL